MRMVAAVLGGGTGQRVGAPLPKQLLKLGGRTLVEHCVAAFEQAPGIDEILVLMAGGYVEQVRAMLADGGYGKVRAVIEGGASPAGLDPGGAGRDRAGHLRGRRRSGRLRRAAA